MHLSRLAQSIKESPTLQLTRTAAKLKAGGEPVINLGGGEPVGPAPVDAIQACTASMSTGDVKYSPADGLPALKKAIVADTQRHYHREVGFEHVVVSSGAKQAIMSTLFCILDPGDEVLYPVPYWVSYPEMVKLAGGIPVPVRAADGSFHPTPEEFAIAVTPRTKAVILNSPNNPSGAVYPAATIAGIVALCEERGLFLIMDDLYNQLVFDDGQVPNVFQFSRFPQDRTQVVVIQGVSKRYAMTGFRIGWALVNPELATGMTSIQSHQTSGPATESQWAAIGALEGSQAGVEQLRMTLENNRDIMVDRLRTLEQLRLTVPAGTFYCFPDFSAYRVNSQELAAFLLEKVRVVTIPGKEFGMEGHLRLSFCGAVKDITEGIERIRWALDPTAPDELRLAGKTVVRDWL